MSGPVDVDELTDKEMDCFNEAIQVFRGVSERQSFHSVPVRDDAAVLSEVWFYWSSDDPKPKAVATIGTDGRIQISRRYT
jgi:hypothetical protein